MYNKFTITKNLKKFMAMMTNLENRSSNVPKMGLVYGEPGLGKTHAMIWWTTKYNAIYIRAANQMNPRWLLEEIVSELGETPKGRGYELFNQCIDKLKSNPQIIVVDEIDYLVYSKNKCIETLRDIHDKTDIPVVLVGMGQANKKLTRFKHLYDRLSEILMFEAFDFKDIKAIVNEMAEVEITDGAIELAFKNTNRFRQIVKTIETIETLAKTNDIKKVDEKFIKGVIGE